MVVNKTLKALLMCLPIYPGDTPMSKCHCDFYSGLGGQPKYLMRSHATFHIISFLFFHMYTNLFS